MDGLTLDTLKQMQKLLADIPPMPFFASWSCFPADAAISFKDGGRDYIGAHPDYWAKIPEAMLEQRNRDVGIFGAIEIVDFRISANAGRKDEFFEAMERAVKAADQQP